MPHKISFAYLLRMLNCYYQNFLKVNQAKLIALTNLYLLELNLLKGKTVVRKTVLDWVGRLYIFHIFPVLSCPPAAASA